MTLAEWLSASDPSALGFVGGVLATCALVIVLEAIRR